MIIGYARFLSTLTLMLLCSCAHQRPGGRIDPVSGVEYSRFVCIATVPGDSQLASRLTDVFWKAGMTTVIEGSRAYSVSVAPPNKTRAVELLREDASVHKYQVFYYGD